MAQTVRDIMTRDPLTLPSSADVVTAAKAMRDSDIGAVLVEQNGRLCGLLSDRDLVVRAIADGANPSAAAIGNYCSKELATLAPTDSVDNAISLMRKKAVRRIPVVENGKPVGIVSLGDLAVERDSKSALGGISSAQPNT